MIERKAKYTELLYDYLEDGGSLPSSFELIEGFDDLFCMHYFDKEIGFETELIFAMKLQELADIYMQAYADKIALLANAWLGYDAPVKVHYTKEDITFNGGVQHSESTELPINSATAQPSMLNDVDAYENTNSREHTLEESGFTAEEAQKRIEFLTSKVNSLLVELLDVFKSCFMAVY